MSLGWQQRKILNRVKTTPGQNSTQLLKGLTRTNQPEKKLETQGYIENRIIKGNTVYENVNSWFITPEGEERLKELKKH